ncbi:uncharacterized protein LOC123317980 [Coccinella septempunctata]|uniref:uncharacterized protein LOC123317980 n=1 Tax=Coccinella septempunctata TaxID=41139 RepID=UPI001D06D51C|nr:uncharacterized protein LOC123317980 [Coccinella septempunctata]
MNTKLEKKSNGSRVTFKKQLVRNPIKTNTRGIVVKEVEKVEPLNLNDVGSSGEPSSGHQSGPKKTKFNVPDIDASMKGLSLKSKSKLGSRTNSLEKDSKTSDSSEKCTNLDTPVINSTLHLSKKIESLGKMKTSSLKTKRAFDEKVTRQVNFPYEKKIFKDLMPLSSPNKRVQKTVSSREPLPPKDKEPVLEDFIGQTPIQEYSYVPNFKLETRRSRSHCNNLRLYKVLQFLEKC